MTEPEEGGYALVMPFVVCETQGGPYNDEAFVNGARWAKLDLAMQVADTVKIESYEAPGLLPQIDLSAMEHGFTMKAEPYNDDWTAVTLTRVPANAEPPR